MKGENKVSLQGEEGKCFNRVLPATLSTHGNAPSASMVTPSLSGEDECREPQIAEDEMEGTQMPSVSWQPRGGHSNEVHHHCDDSLGIIMLVH